MSSITSPLSGIAPSDVRPRSRTQRLARRILFKLAGAIIVLWGVATAAFLAQFVVPGNPAVLLLNLESGRNESSYPASELAPINHQYGLDKSVFVQYIDYLGKIIHGNLGTSYELHQPVLSLIGSQIGSTLVLTIAALVFAWIFALALTVLTARRGRFISGISSLFEVVVAGLPQYWLGVILLVIFAIDLKIFPVEGSTSALGTILPAIVLGIQFAGVLGQVTRDEFDKAMEQPFVVSARARGMSDTGVRLRHALRHAILPGITLSGWALGGLFSSAVIIEKVYARPGIGSLLVNGAESRDVPLVAGIVMVIALVYVVANLLVDIAYTIADPRMRDAV